MKMTQKTDAPASFASQDNLALDQLRLENLWLRQRLHAMSKIQEDWRKAHRKKRIDAMSIAA